MESIPSLPILFLMVVIQRLLPTQIFHEKKFSNVFWKMKFVEAAFYRPMIFYFGRQNPPIRIPDIKKNTHFGARSSLSIRISSSLECFELFSCVGKSGRCRGKIEERGFCKKRASENIMA